MTLWRSTCRRFISPARILLAQQCDLWIFPAQDIFTYLLPLPALGAIHDLMHRYEPQFPEVSAKGEYGKRERHYRNLCQWAKGIVVDSEVGRKQVLESYTVSPPHLHVLPFVAPRNISKDKESSLLDNIPTLPEKFIFYPAQFWQHKNHKVLILALALLRERIPDLHLVFTGAKKNGYNELQNRIRDLKIGRQVTFSGYVSDRDMTYFYRRARAMMMPTFFGPTNIPPLEAMAQGCPTAVSDIYGMREQLGSAALYFNPSSAEGVAQVMEQLWCDDKLCGELSRQGLLHSSQWNQEHFNQKLLSILNKVLSPGYQ
ncbi:glycosyltransferase family 4 protein [Syntrophus gentianae]|nr:glycosyltransferase family 1 protein [Syntrophus gentianae]